MSRTIDDLRQTLEAHSRELPPSAARTVAVRRRVRRIRRQRACAGVLAVVLLAGVGAVGVHLGTDRTGQTGSGRAPEYANGGRLVATADIDSRTSTSSQGSFVATGDTLIVTERGCTASLAQKLAVQVLVDGAAVGDVSCLGTGNTATTMQPGIAAGQRVNVTARLVADGPPPTPFTEAQRAALPDTRVRVAFYQPVSRADYQFPPRPAKLADFPPAGDHGSGDSEMGATNGASETHLDVTHGLDVEITTRAPGVITLDLDGHRIGTAQSWDYSLTTSSVRMTPAQLSAIGVTESTTAEYATLIASGSDFRVPSTSIAWQVAMLSPDNPSFRDGD